MSAAPAGLKRDWPAAAFLPLPGWVWIALLPPFLIRLAVAWMPVNQSFAFSVPDDGYYYFKIAQNIVSGGGISFDGLAPTNGFHPLWLALITPFWWAAGRVDNQLPIHLALTLGAAIDVATVIGIWTLARRMLMRPFVAGLVVLVYAWNPYNAAASINGLETSLAAGLLVWSLAAWWQLRLSPRPAPRAWLGLGLLWALLGLARTDYLIILLPCALDLAWRFRSLWRSAWPAALGAIVWAPWLLWNLATFQSLAQVSGNAYPYYQHAVWSAGQHSVTELLAHEASLGYGVLANLARLSGFDKGLFVLALGAAWVMAEAALHPERGSRARLNSLAWPTLAAVALLLFHALVRWMYVPWYFVPASILLAIWFGIVLDRLAEQRLAWAWVLGGLFLALQVWQGAALWNQGGMWASQRQAIEHQMPKYLALCEQYATIGITDSGYAGYYLPCRVVNLDGVVNNESYKALVGGRFRSYLDDAHIEYVILNDLVRQTVELREGAVPTTAPFAPR